MGLVAQAVAAEGLVQVDVGFAGEGDGGDLALAHPAADGAGAGGLAAGDEEAAVLYKGGGGAEAGDVDEGDFVAPVDVGGGEDAHVES